MALKTTDAPNFAGMTQRMVDAWWDKRPKKRARVLRPFLMLSRAYDGEGHCVGFGERYTTVPGVVLELNPLMHQELLEALKIESVADDTPLTQRLPGPDPYGWEAHCKADAAERAKVPYSQTAILAALTAAVQGAQGQR
jgi:hypothetical protein